MKHVLLYKGRNTMKRRHDETYEEYKERRNEAKKELREKMKGWLFWDSKNQGTYRKGKDNP